MKIICLNVNHGGGSRWENIRRFLEAQDADVIVLPEWHAGAPERDGWAASLGMSFDSATNGKNRNGVFVAAKQNFSAKNRTPGEGSSGALLLVEFASWSMLACYVPGVNSKERKLKEEEISVKTSYFEVCREVASDAGTRSLLIVGDLNTGNQNADRTAKGLPYECAEHFDDLSRKHDLADLWRRTNGPEAREWTKRITRDGLFVNGFRLDHAFGNSQFVSTFDPVCWYEHRPWGDGFSDHSAIVVASRKPVRPSDARRSAKFSQG